MQVSESDARKKWCPYVRVDGDNRVPNTRTDGFENTDQSYRCIASRCMGWREFRMSFMHGSSESVEKHGYCGLAGRPAME